MTEASPPADASPRIVRCPTCGGPSVYAKANAFRPFCGERCRDIDLGAWASEAYRVAAPAVRPDGDDEVDPEAH